MIVGHSMDDKSSGHYLSEKLARKAFCSVLILPKNASVKLDNVLVALDFSDHCLNSLDVGSAFAKAAGLDSIDLIHTFRVPEGYYKTGKNYDQFAGIMLDNAKTKLRQFISRADLKGLGIKPYFKMKDDVVKGILEFADDKSASLVVVGARGRSGDIAFILLGSVTEGLIRNLQRPLLAVKKKGEGLNILDALFSA
jgi:nucleotide-binding universal stress UspA family protein